METLLVFELRMMGDAITGLPFIRTSLASYRVVVCCTPARRDVFATYLPQEDIITWEPPWIVEDKKYALKRWREAGWGAFLRKLRAIRADVAVSVWCDPRVDLLMALSGARQRIGFPIHERNYYAHEHPDRRRQMKIGRFVSAFGSLILGRRLINRPLYRRDYYQHHVEDWHQLAEALALPWQVETPWLHPQREVPESVKAVCQQATNEGRPAWVWHVGARLASHRWPIKKVEQVVREYFIPKGIPLTILGSLEDVIPSSLAELAPVVRTATFQELCAVIGAHDYLLCNDTGVSHLGAALGKRVMAIFSSAEPRWLAPYGNRDLVVENNVCPHRPCFDRCVMPSWICLDAVNPDFVIQKLEQLEMRSFTPTSS